MTSIRSLFTYFDLSFLLIFFTCLNGFGEIIAIDRLAYPLDTALLEYHGNASKPKSDPMLSGGFGWKSPWTQWYGARENDARIRLSNLEDVSLQTGVPRGYAMEGNAALRISHASLGRELSRTVGGRGTTSYIAFLSRHASKINGDDAPVGVGFQLLQGGITGQPVFSFIRKARDIWGIDTLGDPSVDNTNWHEDEKAYFTLLKIVDDGTTAHISASRFSEQDTVIQEPETWQVRDIQIPSFTFDTVYFKGNKPGYNSGASHIWIDEVRMGTQFEDLGFNKANLLKLEEQEAEEAARKAALELKIKEWMKTAWVPGENPMPEGSNIANVVAFGAARDGVTDDTAAINRALAASRNVYFPPGIYLVSGTLKTKSRSNNTPRTRMIGAGRDSTIIRLQEGVFKDKQKPGAVISFYGNYPEVKNTTGDSFSNYLTDLTIEIGPDNPGATGVAYITNNDGAIRNVAIRSLDPEGKGFCAIDMRKGWCGPGIIKDVEIVGFDTAVNYAYREYSMTIENLTLEGQLVAGIVNQENILSIHNLVSRNTVPALINGSPRALTVLLNASLTGGQEGQAIINKGGYLYLRDIEAGGYDQILDGNPRQKIQEYSSIPAPYSIADPVIKDHVIMPLPLDQWVSVAAYGANPDDKLDDSEAVQKAINAAAESGLKKVYFPMGGVDTFKGNHYRIEAPVRLYGSVEEIDFLYAPVEIGKEGGFIVDEGPAPVVVFQRAGQVWGGGGTLVHHKAERDVHLRDFPHQTTTPYKNLGSRANVFLENIAPVNAGSIGPFMEGQHVWGRSINPENSGVHLHNKGATVWVLGFKIEQNGVSVLTEEDGKTWVFGGLIYPNRKHFSKLQGDFPSFKTIDATQFLAGLATQENGGTSRTPVEDRRGDAHIKFHTADFQSNGYKGNEWLIPIYVTQFPPEASE
ncbi:MAG: glycosyl hydrolase family 28-related protein [Kiritimatiellia bacterium]